MSAYDEAYHAGMKAAHDEDNDAWAHNYGSGADVRQIVGAFMEAFLAALPPSIVVDGRVVELAEVAQHMEQTGHGFVVAKVEHREMLAATRSAAAAREVAE